MLRPMPAEPTASSANPPAPPRAAERRSRPTSRSGRRAETRRGEGAGHHSHTGPELHGHRHRDIQGGWARAAVFGVSDGLVTNVSLILGMAGAHPGAGVVRLAGIAGLVAGCWSMAMGEYISMRAQRELLERELAKEREEIQRRPEGERHELVHIYESRGVDPAVARQLAAEMMRTPELALETHAREELGVDPSELGSPWAAGLSSFVTFGLGALLPLLPWFVTAGTLAVAWSIVIGGVASLVVGGALAVFTERSWWWSSLRQLLLAAVAAGITYGIGAAIGVTVPGA
jgi:VIT1/CCC1 family predicted Fe2+/Mn2+ transporter